eukprot:scaffold24808_cov102-Cyclotella_meneghiniana.AAC.4
MLEREESRGNFREVKLTANKGKGRKTIGERYRLAYSAPIMTNNKLLEDVGFSGDGPAVESILRGDYVFPEAHWANKALMIGSTPTTFNTSGY